MNFTSRSCHKPKEGKTKSQLVIETMEQSSASTRSIPRAIILEILAKLPLKSVVRFRCVSKFCNSSAITPSFVKSHTTNFPIKPIGLLITCSARLQSGQLFFYADYNGGSAVPLLTIPPRFSRYTTKSLNGLLCLDFGICAQICNPSTRQAFTLPVVVPVNSPSASSTYFCVNSFGFDPLTKQYKVLNSWKIPGEDPEYRVFTLGTDQSWRLVKGGPSYYSQRESICIDGIIYFRCWTSTCISSKAVLVAFDVGKETFQVIQIPDEISVDDKKSTDLIAFAGNPAIVSYNHIYDDEGSSLLIVWSVKDSIWDKHGLVMPSDLQELQTKQAQLYYVAGTIQTGELVLAPRRVSRKQHFYVLYYDVLNNVFRRVEIFGLPDYAHQFNDFSCIDTITVSNYEENILSFA
ncbi:hypothetical protein Ddye_030713 [Dipteronia dyeriana]|uniref:F-box domain-containing protein n=1 Tax=Dipteronia dyeriana TaxID=168575 RepID=A0AAD9TH65_9ROSI|nr:hypothetical protein Ddye_030713 [Dipteronia dyeriana]